MRLGCYRGRTEAVLRESWKLIDPAVRRPGRIAAAFAHVNFKFSARSFSLPIGDGIASIEEKRTAAKVDIANQNAAEVTNVTDVVTSGTEFTEEFDGGHHADEYAHREDDRGENQSHLTIRKKHRVGDQDPKNGAGCADRGHVHAGLAEVGGSPCGGDIEQARANSAGEVIPVKLARAPHVFQIAAKHPQDEQIDEDMHQSAVEEEISERLP